MPKVKKIWKTWKTWKKNKKKMANFEVCFRDKNSKGWAFCIEKVKANSKEEAKIKAIENLEIWFNKIGRQNKNLIYYRTNEL